MAELTVFVVQPDGSPLTSPGDLPEIQIRRIDTQAIVQAFTAMTEIGDGFYSYTFAPSATLDYTWIVDADPSTTGQAIPRYFGGSLSGPANERILTDIPDILVDTGTTIPALIAALNDISVADILSGVLAGSGESVDTALSRLDNIDTSVTTTIPGLIAALNDISVADILTAVLSGSAESVDAALSRLIAFNIASRSNNNDLDSLLGVADVAGRDLPEQVDVELTAAHGAGAWTSGSSITQQDVRDAMKLAPTGGAPAAGSVDEHLDDILADTSAIDARLPADPADESNQIAEHGTTQAAIAALNDLAIADVQTAMTNQGYTSGRAPNLDNLDATVSSRSSHDETDVDTQLSGTHGGGSWEDSGSINQQDVRDAMKLAPTAGAPATGSIDDDLDLIKGAGFATGTDSLEEIRDAVDAISAVVGLDEAEVAVHIPPLERPAPTSTFPYKILVTVRDGTGALVDADAGVTIGVTDQAGASRNANLSSTSMTNVATGRYEVDYNVADTHAIEQLIFSFTLDVASVAVNVPNHTTTVIDATEGTSELVGSGF